MARERERIGPDHHDERRPIASSDGDQMWKEAIRTDISVISNSFNIPARDSYHLRKVMYLGLAISPPLAREIKSFHHGSPYQDLILHSHTNIWGSTLSSPASTRAMPCRTVKQFVPNSWDSLTILPIADLSQTLWSRDLVDE